MDDVDAMMVLNRLARVSDMASRIGDATTDRERELTITRLVEIHRAMVVGEIDAIHRFIRALGEA